MMQLRGLWWTVVFAALVMVFGCSAVCSGAASPAVWAVSDMERIGRTDAPGRVRDITVYAARGEYAAFQVVVQAPEGGLDNVSLQVSDLKGPGNSVIPGGQLVLYREHYVLIDRGSPDRPNATVHPGKPGWYADGLIPFIDPATGKAPVGARFKASPAEVPAGENQPYWIEVLVPRDAKAGKYTGKYTVTSDQGKVAGKVTLNVWDFTLPVKPSEGSVFVVWQDMTPQIVSELTKHRIAPCILRPDQANYMKDPALASHLTEDLGLSIANVGFFSGADVSNLKMSASPSVEALKATASQFPKDIRLVNYTADEIWNAPHLNEPLREWARNLHQAGIEQLVVATPLPELFDDGTGKPAVDIWSIMPFQYDRDPERIHETWKRGMEVWTYTACNQDDYAPKWLADFDPIHHRALQGYLNQSLGFTGILYWAVDHWISGTPRTNTPMKDIWSDITYHLDVADLAGEGCLIYPGKDVGIDGIVPSMRMKWIRKGMEDYEYVELLKKAGKKDLALQLSKSVAPDFKNWSKNPADYEKVRRQIAEALTKGK